MKQAFRLSNFFLVLVMVLSTMIGCSPTAQTTPTTAGSTPNAPTSPTEPEVPTEPPVEEAKIDEEQVEAIKTILADEMMRALPPAQAEPLPDAVIYETETYQIHRKDGHCYLNLFDGNKHSGEPSSSGCIFYSPYLYFDALEQLYDALTTDTLSDGAIQGITRCFPLDAEQGFYLPDPHQFFSIILPDGLEFSKIQVYGEDMSYSYRELDKDYPRLSGYVDVCSQQHFKACLRHFNRFRANPSLYRTAHTVPEVSGIAYDCDAPAGVFRYVQYCVQTDSKTLFIEETYAVERSHPGAIASDTVPLEITVYGYENGYYFCVTISGAQARLSLNFLNGFHIEPYIPE